MISRTEAAGYAEGWADRADQHATEFRDLGYTAALTEPKRAAHYGALRDQARDMALMWATIAQLHDAAPAVSGKRFFEAASQYNREVEQANAAAVMKCSPGPSTVCHSRYQHASGIAACADGPHHLGMHLGDGFAWTTSQATEDTRYFGCGYCGCAENPATCGCDHEGDAVPHQQASVAPS